MEEVTALLILKGRDISSSKERKEEKGSMGNGLHRSVCIDPGLHWSDVIFVTCFS